jgi:hypothetical protein
MNDQKHLVSAEVDNLRTAAIGSQYEAHEQSFLLLLFRQGSAVSEAGRLRLSRVDTGNAARSCIATLCQTSTAADGATTAVAFPG